MKKYIAIVTAVAFIAVTPLAVLARNNDQQQPQRRVEQPRTPQRQEAPRQRVEIPRQQQSHQEAPRRVEQPQQAPAPKRVPETLRAPERHAPQARPETPKTYPTPRTYETPKTYPVPRVGDLRGGDHQPKPPQLGGDHRGNDHRDGDRGRDDHHYGNRDDHRGDNHHGWDRERWRREHHTEYRGHGHGHYVYGGQHHYRYGHRGLSFGEALGIVGALVVIDAANNALRGQAAADYAVRQCDEYHYYGYDCELQRRCTIQLLPFPIPVCRIVVVPVLR